MCTSPIQLKTGETVPCGKCLDCLSHRRNEWSIRLQLHSLAYDRMPFFVTLTYRDEDLPLTPKGQMTLRPKDVVDFMKRLRAKYNLYNSDFSFFGCGEYGDSFGRPHYHLILFGFDALQQPYDVSAFQAEYDLEKVWQHGHVDVCIAEYSGIHYVTKYVLKSKDDYMEDVVRPYTFSSKGIGKVWLSSDECQRIRKKFNKKSLEKVINNLPDVCWNTPQTIIRSCTDIIKLLKPYVMDFKVTLSDDSVVPMPRYYRKKIFGSFEDWRANPLAYYNYVRSLRHRYEYLIHFKDYDKDAQVTMEKQKQQEKERLIRTRIINKIK